MAGRRLLDVAALLSASRSVAQKHVALRAHQLDVYSRTSSLAKAVKIQTDRVTTLTANAAKDISETSSQVSRQGQGQGQGQSSAAGIPSNESTEGTPPKHGPVKEGLEQDHHYDRSEANTAVDAVPEGDLNVRQEKADRNPLPDGTIPPAGSLNNVPKQGQDVYSDIPSTEPPKAPLSKEDATTKEDDLKPKSSTTSTIPEPSHQAHQPSSEEARKLQRQAESQIPSVTADPQAAAPDDSGISSLSRGHDEDVFYIRSARSSPVLSGLPRLKIPKQTETRQEAGIAAKDGINADVFYSPGAQQRQESTVVENATVPAQSEVPEDIDMAIFYSPHVAKALGGKVHGTRENRNAREGSAQDRPSSKLKASEGKSQESAIVWRKSDPDVEELAADIAKDAATIPEKVTAQASQGVGYQMHESRVPSSRLGRLWHYGGLATGMAFGAVGESLRRATGNSDGGSLILSPGNMERLVAKLSRMRGAALKLGQMISFQDSKMLPAPIQEVLQRVQDSADYMPASQRDQVLARNLGKDWRDLFSSFEEVPMAAASIGQVHGAVLKSNGQRVAVKIQYPGVADSIDSDLNNLSLLLTASRLLPKGLYLDKTIANARTELAWECDYIREAECGRKFRDLLKDQDVFVVPEIFAEASGKQVLTMERMEGVAVTKVMNFDQEQKDWVGSQILRLCLREITEFKYMQTDPNWTNFLYNANTQKLELLDFGASREYPDEFIDLYTRVLSAASKGDRDACRTLSIKLGYLTGYESEVMLNAHVSSILTLAEPFRDSSPDIYDFKDQTITERVTALIPVMMRERLAPPPEETYSLHRKLSGAFLLCARLGSRVRCREMFAEAMEKAGIQKRGGFP